MTILYCAYPRVYLELRSSEIACFSFRLIRSAGLYGMRVNRSAGGRTSEWTFEMIDRKLA